MSAARARHDSGITRGDLRAEILTFEDVTVGYGGSPVLDGATFNVRRGEIAGVVSLDGRGRSTLVKCAGGLLEPTKGEVSYESRNIYDMSFGEDQKFRARSAVVLEGGALLVNRTIFENVALPLRYHLGMKDDDLEHFVTRLFTRVGYTGSPDALPWQVSARDRKLASIARALVREPELVLIDRFFESLDSPDHKRIMELVLELNVKSGTSFLIVGELSTHIFQVAERVIVLEAGRVLAHDFKRGLFKNEKIKRAFEEGEEQFAATSARETRPFETRSIEDTSALLHPTPLTTESQPFDPDEDSGLMPIVVLTDPPSRKTRKPRRSATFNTTASPMTPAAAGGDPNDEGPDSEATANLPPEAAAQIVRKVRERLEAEVAAALGDSASADSAPADSTSAGVVSERRETSVKVPRSEAGSISEIPNISDDESERTLTLAPDATAELVRQAKARAADRLEAEAREIESHARPNEVADRELLQSEVVAEFRDAQAFAAAQSGPEFTERPTRELGPPPVDRASDAPQDSAPPDEPKSSGAEEK